MPPKPAVPNKAIKTKQVKNQNLSQFTTKMQPNAYEIKAR